jgi:DNA-binding CsgD family transcriptional regulator
MELLPDRIASMMSTMGHEAFGRSVLELFDPEMEITHCAAYERLAPGQAPRVVVACGPDAHADSVCGELARQWMEQDHCIDPILVDIERRADEQPGVHYVDVPSAPGCVGARARMVEQYYDRLGLGQEATYAVRDGSRVVSVSLYKRRGSAAFTLSQRESLGRLSQLMLKSTDRHAQLLPQAPKAVAAELADAAAVPSAQGPEWAQTRADKFAHLRSALLMDASHLTLREAEICAYIVMGYTVLAISLMLGISANTVATHRKRAYSKLGLSSQTELFNVCLKYCV